MVPAQVLPTGLMKRLVKPGYFSSMYSCASFSFHWASASWNITNLSSMSVPLNSF